MTKRKMAEAGSKPSTSKQRPGVFELFQGDGGEETSDNDSNFDLGNDLSVADSSEESDSSDSGESVRSTLNVSADNADETHTIEQRVYLASRKYMTIIGSVQ
eukprot:TRINITY_DN4954_c0_g1_i13.p1 TRINITY_DN4954_c0_g1~~TRINITY_DN4954_c0_g1_i13.p1  ORF type:complete len:102 (-),score=16.90 TRINITY_DN4954_c0_g1_i13:136-441(-)